MVRLIQNTNPLSILDYLFTKSIPFVYLKDFIFLWKNHFSKSEKVLFVVSIIGSLFDIRTLIYTSFIFCLIYLRSEIYKKNIGLITFIFLFQVIYWVVQIGSL